MTPKSPPDITVFDIADWFLAKAKAEDKPLRHMKLQKLVYFAYGWYYAYHNESLFPETIYAFRHGPVVKELYDRFETFGGNPITEDVEKPDFETQAETILSSTWQAYEHYTDFQLSDITHTHPPWIDAYRSDKWFAVMSPESIRVHFKNLLDKQSNAKR